MNKVCGNCGRVTDNGIVFPETDGFICSNCVRMKKSKVKSKGE